MMCLLCLVTWWCVRSFDDTCDVTLLVFDRHILLCFCCSDYWMIDGEFHRYYCYFSVTMLSLFWHCQNFEFWTFQDIFMIFWHFEILKITCLLILMRLCCASYRGYVLMQISNFSRKFCSVLANSTRNVYRFILQLSPLVNTWELNVLF